MKPEEKCNLMMNNRFLYRKFLELQIKKCISDDSFKSSYWIEPGIGWGRLAIPIIETIDNDRYYGFDINQACLDKLQEYVNSSKGALWNNYSNGNFGKHFKKRDFRRCGFPFPELKKDKNNSTFTLVIASFLSHVPNGLHLLREKLILPILKAGKKLNIILFQCEKNLITLMAEDASFNQILIEAEEADKYNYIIEPFKRWNNQKEKDFKRTHSLVSLEKITATDMAPIASFLNKLGFAKNEELSKSDQEWNPATHGQRKLDFQWLREIFSDVPYMIMREGLRNEDIKKLKKEIADDFKDRDIIEDIFSNNENREINTFQADFWVYQFEKTDFELNKNFSFKDIIISKDALLPTNGGAQLRDMKKNQEYLGSVFTLGDSLKGPSKEMMKKFSQYNFAVIPKEISRWFTHGVLTENVVLGFYSYVSPSKREWIRSCGVLFPYTSIITKNVNLFDKYTDSPIWFSSLLFKDYYYEKIEQNGREYNRLIIKINENTMPIKREEDPLGSYIFLQIQDSRNLIADEFRSLFCPKKSEKEVRKKVNLFFADIKDDLTVEFTRRKRFKEFKFLEKINTSLNNNISLEGLKEFLGKIKEILLADFETLKGSEFGSLYLNKLRNEKDKMFYMCSFYDLEYYSNPWKNSWKYCYYFLEFDNALKKYISGLAIYQKKELSLQEQSVCLLLSTNLRRIIIDRENQIITHMYALRSAFAAILSRNVSHTMGSHALSYLSDADILKEYEEKRGRENSLKKTSRLLNYIKGRMEYIADVSTLSPFWGETMGFYNDFLRPFFEQFLLIDNLNRSIYIIENGKPVEFRAEKIVFKLSVKENDNTDAKYYKFEYDNSGEIKPNKIDLEDINILIPHGLAGKHAFYSFLENYIRNCCKHEYQQIEELLKDNSKKLCIHFEVFINQPEEWNAELIRVQISDNLKNFSPKNYKKINRFIDGDDKEFLNIDNSIRGDGWGIYEMRISCGWLRSAKTEEISSINFIPPILKILNPVNTGEKLKYEFYLQKPLDILIISNGDNVKEDKNCGIYKVNDLDKLDSMCSMGGIKHQFVIIDIKNQRDADWILDEKNHLKLPIKTFIFVSAELHKLEKIADGFNEIRNKFVFCPLPLKELVKKLDNLKYKLQTLFNKWLYAYDLVEMELQLPKCIRRWSKDEIENIKEKSIVFAHGVPGSDAVWCKNKNILRTTYFQPYTNFKPENIVGQKAHQYLQDSNSEKGKFIGQELLEVGLTRILVVDERIFKKVYEKKIKTLEGIGIGGENGVELNRVWQLMGVDVVDIKREGGELTINYFAGINRLGSAERPKDKPHENDKLCDYFKNTHCAWTYILIHQSIIDDHIKDDLENVSLELKKRCRSIIIHTGRGAVKIEKGYKFIEFSNLEEHLVDNPNKYKLINKLSRLTGGKGKNESDYYNI